MYRFEFLQQPASHLGERPGEKSGLEIGSENIPKTQDWGAVGTVLKKAW